MQTCCTLSVSPVVQCGVSGWWEVCMNGNVSRYMGDVGKAGIFSQEMAFATNTRRHAVPWKMYVKEWARFVSLSLLGKPVPQGTPGSGDRAWATLRFLRPALRRAPGKLEAPRTPHPLHQRGQRVSQCSGSGGGSGSGCVSLLLPGESGERTSQGQI